MVESLRIPEASACIHCGLCLSACPTYLETGNENDSPRGRIHLMRALQDRRLELDPTAVRHLDLCLGCRACETACPSGVPYGTLIEAARAHVETHHRRPLAQNALRRWLIEGLFPHPERLRWALAPARLLQRADATHLFPTLLREPLELLPPPAPESTLPARSPATAASKLGTLGLLSGCVMQVLFSATNANCIRLLNAAGWDVVVPPRQDCCGALFAHSGQLESARDRARTNIAAFESLGLDGILIGAAGCGSTLKEYGHLLEADPLWADRARAFAGKVRDLSEWLTAPAPASAPAPTAAAGMRAPARPTADTGPTALPGRVTFHDACHLAHAQRVTQPPRRLVQAVAGERFVELPEADVCCGSAGSYNLTEPDMARRLQRRKIDNILRSGATTVITTNPGCLLQIQAGLRAVGAHHVRALHIADYLAETSGQGQPWKPEVGGP